MRSTMVVVTIGPTVAFVVVEAVEAEAAPTVVFVVVIVVEAEVIVETLLKYSSEKK